MIWKNFYKEKSLFLYTLQKQHICCSLWTSIFFLLCHHTPQEKAGQENELISNFHLACSQLNKEPVPESLRPTDLYSRLDESEQNQYKVKAVSSEWKNKQ